MVVTLENKMFFNPFRLGQAENEKVQMDSPKKKAVGFRSDSQALANPLHIADVCTSSFGYTAYQIANYFSPKERKTDAEIRMFD